LESISEQKIEEALRLHGDRISLQRFLFRSLQQKIAIVTDRLEVSFSFFFSFLSPPLLSPLISFLSSKKSKVSRRLLEVRKAIAQIKEPSDDEHQATLLRTLLHSLDSLQITNIHKVQGGRKRVDREEC
jgi:hypothetical protein